MSKLSQASKIGLFLWASFMGLVLISSLGQHKEKPPEYIFPSPDPNRGQAWGWNFHTNEYRYASKFKGELPPAKASKVRSRRVSSDLRITDLRDIKDIHDLDQYINNQRVIVIREEFTEDDARDLLDYMGD